MEQRKSRSPKEILSLFDGIVRWKKRDGQSSTDELSIFDAIQTQDKSNAQELLHSPGPERPDFAHPQPQVASSQTPPASRPRMPSWKLAEEAARSKRTEADTAMKATHRQTFWSRTREQIENKLFTPKQGVSTARRKVMTTLVPVLFIVLIFALTQISLGPMITGRGTSDLAVKSILYKQNNPSAIVNNQIVHEGDKISGATIIKINKDSVEFEVRKRWRKEAYRYTKKVHR